MLAVVVRLEQRNAEIKLKHDAPDGPNIARLRPSQLEDDFRRAVMSRRHDGAVMFVIERGAAEVDQPDVAALDAADLAVLKRWKK